MAEYNEAGPKRESESPDPARLVKRYEYLWGQAGNVRTTQQTLAEFITPNKSDITIERTPGQERTQRVWDSTAIHANVLLASSIQGSLMSQAIRWFSLKLRNAEAMSKTVTDWLEQVEDRIYLALRQSNFNSEAGELCLDLGAFGIGAFFVEERQPEPGAPEGFAGFRFQTLAPGQYVISENHEGRVDTLFRCYKMSAKAIEQAWGQEARELPEPVRNALQARPDQEFEVIHAVYPRKVDNPKRKDGKHKPWASCYLDRRTKTILSEGGYEEFPYMVPRWAKCSGTSTDVYGYGPGHTALNDIRVLSRAKELTLSAASKAIDPPGLTNSDAVFGELDIRPASQNPVDGDPRLAWMPMESGAKFDLSQFLTGDLRTAIQHVFYWDQLQLQGDKLMTATEVERRLELMRRVLGPTLGRFESELLNPLLGRCFGIMYRAGALPLAPEELSGQDLDIEYEGPLARSQKATRLAAFDEILQKIAAVAAFAPATAQQMLDNLEIDDVFRDQCQIAGLTSKNMKDPETRDKERAEREMAAANAAQLERGVRFAEAAGKAAPMVREMQAAGAMQGMGGATNGATGRPAA